MKEYRISKYDPQFRVNGAYQKNEWTSVSDIGKVFDDGVLTFAEYLRVENEYIQFCLNAMKAAGVTGLSVCAPEIYCEGLRLPKRVCDTDSICEIIRWCLREKCWAKLEGTRFFLHFGYDYYLYIGTDVPKPLVETLAKEQNLYYEYYRSPYGENRDDVSP